MKLLHISHILDNHNFLKYNRILFDQMLLYPFDFMGDMQEMYSNVLFSFSTSCELLVSRMFPTPRFKFYSQKHYQSTLTYISLQPTRVIQYVLKPDVLYLLYINYGKNGVIQAKFQPFSFICHLFCKPLHAWLACNNSLK